VLSALTTCIILWFILLCKRIIDCSWISCGMLSWWTLLSFVIAVRCLVTVVFTHCYAQILVFGWWKFDARYKSRIFKGKHNSNETFAMKRHLRTAQDYDTYCWDLTHPRLHTHTKEKMCWFFHKPRLVRTVWRIEC